jgi:hypothetical protein
LFAAKEAESVKKPAAKKRKITPKRATRKPSGKGSVEKTGKAKKGKNPGRNKTTAQQAPPKR